MQMNQIYNIVNSMTSEMLGTTELLREDLSNIVDVGTDLFNNASYDAVTKSLVDHIGRVVFVDRVYRGSVPSVLMDGWEYGAVLEKITAELPKASENESWELQDGQSYDPNIFYAPKVSAKFYNKRITFEVDKSFTRRQLRTAFSSAEQLNGFMSMIFNSIENALTVAIDGLVMRTINNMTAETLYSEFESGEYAKDSGVRAVNLLHLYNVAYPDDVQTAESAIRHPGFIRFAAMTMGLYIDRLGKMSTLFNVGGKERFTPKDLLHVVMLSDFKQAANVYLQSDTFNEQYTALPNAETVPYWQGSGLDYGFGSVSEINVTTPDGHNVEASGILAVMWDRDALGVTNIDRRTETHYNPKAEFTNYFYKYEAGYFNDLNENFVVFFVA